MNLGLYRRHRRNCKAGHKEESRSGAFEVRKKGWKRCDSPIFASGTLNKKFKRQSTGVSNWDDAKAATTEWVEAGCWDGTVPPVVEASERTLSAAARKK